MSPEELSHYARHLTLPQVGRKGQEKLKASRVLCIGAGGLGSPVLLYLAAAGVGHLTILDDDQVERSNLQRQILYSTEDLGKPKAEVAAQKLRAINPHIDITIHRERFGGPDPEDLQRALERTKGHHLLIDGTDNFATRYLSNDIAVLLGIPNLYGSVYRFEGQCSVFAPHLSGGCYRCMFPTPPSPDQVPSCQEGGVFGVLPGLIGLLQATEAIKLLTGIGEPLTGRLLHLDALPMRMRTISLRRDPDCIACGEHPRLTPETLNIEDYQFQCAVDDQPELSTTSAQELQTLRTNSPKAHTLLDVRETHERDICTITGSLHIPLGELRQRMAEIPTERPLIVHCKSGARSAQALAQLQQDPARTNQTLTHLEGGILAWIEEIDPSLTKY